MDRKVTYRSPSTLLRGRAWQVVAALLLVIRADAAEPKLDQDCVISILNRTIQVNSRGGWALPNVPSTQGQIRARATCLRDGQTISGQSEYFTVINNGVVTVPQIVFTDLDPIPQTLTFGATSTNMVGVNSTRQLALQANYVDGTTR